VGVSGLQKKVEEEEHVFSVKKKVRREKACGQPWFGVKGQ